MLNAFRHHRSHHKGVQVHEEGRLAVLNAFRHHRSHHGWPCQGHHSTGSPVLNAFRHHRSHHTARTPTTCTRSPSAQRLSASQISSLRRSERRESGWACSTPFGITDLITVNKEGIYNLVKECSTPFGITDLITRLRLGLLHFLLQCSTPFGITDLITPRSKPT